MITLAQRGNVLWHRYAGSALDSDQSDDKKRARLNAMRYVLHLIPYAERDLKAIGPIDPLIVGRASTMFETAEYAAAPHILAGELVRPNMPPMLPGPKKKKKK